MSDTTGNGKMVMRTENGPAQGEKSALPDLVIGGLDIQLSPSLQGGAGDTANARAMAYRDRILEAAGRSRETA